MGIGYFDRYKVKDFEKDLFMVRNNGKLPFTVFSNQYSMIKSRKINHFSKLIEIGYPHNDETAANNYWLNKNEKRKTYLPYGARSKDLQALYEKYYKNKNVRNRHDRKRKRKYLSQRNSKPIDIKQYYPKKYLYLREYGHGPRPRSRRKRANRRWHIMRNRLGEKEYWWKVRRNRKNKKP